MPIACRQSSPRAPAPGDRAGGAGVDRGRYLVLYRAQDDGIEVVRVVHGAREIEQIEF
jgi:plasmid stabilization system protein ParE